MTWHSAFLESLIPKWMIKAIYPIDKTDLDMLRFTHFLALAIFVTLFIPRKWKPLQFNMAAPDDPVRSALAADFLYRRPAVVFRALDPDAIHQGCLGAACRLASPASSSWSGAAWLLDRAERVPNLFVKVTDIDDERNPPPKALPVTIIDAAPAGR